MALRVRADNLAIEHPAPAVDGGAPAVDFEELWAYHGDVQALCRRIVGDDGTADDILQDTFLRALVNARQLDRRVSFAPWLVTVARRRSIDRLRSDGRAQPMAVVPESSMASSVDGDPVEHVLQQERVRRVREALATLRPRERQLLMRQIAHGLSVSDLAAEEDTTIGSVRSVLSRARTKLRAELERGGPLGVAPAPGLVAAAKRRFHRLAVRLEGSMPMLAGGGAQFGDVVMAAVAAVALLIAGNVPPSEAPSQFLTALAGAEQPVPVPESTSPSKKAGALGEESSAPLSAAPATATTTTTTAPSAPWSPFGKSSEELTNVPRLIDEGGNQPAEAAIQEFAESPEGDALFVAGNPSSSGDPSIYRSLDDGATWQRLNAAYYQGGPLLIPAGTSSSLIFAATESGPLLESRNGGSTFEPAAAPRGPAALLPPAPATGASVLVSTPNLVAYDSQTRLTRLVGFGPAAVASDVAVPDDYATSGVVLVAGREPVPGVPNDWPAFVYRCNATGCSRAPLTTGRDVSIHASKSVPGLVLAWVGGKLFRSTDNGVTFTGVPLPSGVRLSHVTDGDTGEVLIASIGLLGTGAGVFRSTDGAQTWTALGTTFPSGKGARTVIRTASGNILAGLSPGPGLVCSADDGATWASSCP